MRIAIAAILVGLAAVGTTVPQQVFDPVPKGMISPSRPVAKGMAPGMQSKLLRQSEGERVYAIIFSTGDEAISGLTDFAIANHVADAHFTAIGASESALMGWFDLKNKNYRAMHVKDQREVLAFTGDIAMFNGMPIVHAHSVLARMDGSTLGGHTFELHVNPTLEVFLTVDDVPLTKRQDATGLKLIDPAK